MISMPRGLLVGLAALFSAYHVVLGLYSLAIPASPWPSVVAMALYGAATAVSLAPSAAMRMPVGMAAANVGVTAFGLVLVLTQLDPADDNGYATWIVGAVGTLMTITVVRQRPLFAWLGLGVMLVSVLIWSRDILSLPALGAVGGPIWVGVAQATTTAIVRAARDATLFEQAEQRAAEWHAQEEAEFFERKVRLGQMKRVVEPMLRRIVMSDGRLGDGDRQECLHLEAAMRDEIRGRRLLDDAVRREVLAARRRGVEVTLLDDGGIDDLDRTEHARVTAVIAKQIGETTADRVVVRTGHADDEVAVTIVGLRAAPESDGSVLDDDAQLDLWLEVPREDAPDAAARAIGADTDSGSGSGTDTGASAGTATSSGASAGTGATGGRGPAPTGATPAFPPE
ncbi:hypothetical protein [Herbiconiux daphne]|uniref:Uncharacterized protein n=1 Tax=Herbiconiux daphne TaxID=2970914 RepID=A0ABT2H4J9_9MICO|nr:hypothetical protein [Herbiconiux daphne]MCS5734855.1 hypothetical protein [Herbiconiux daphne]